MKINFRFIQFAIFLLTFISATTAAFADVKIKTRQTSQGASPSEYTTYIKGKRQRIETSPEMASITQCDLRRSVQLAPTAKTYMVTPFNQPGSAQTSVTKTSSGKTETVVTRGGVVTSTITTRDTGERKQMFGYAARHVITTIETESSPDACSLQKSKMEMDMWVIDGEFALDCKGAFSASSYEPPAQNGCQDKYVTKTVGTIKSGFPLYQKMTIFNEGKIISSSISEVIELSKANLDAALFDVPADYREAKDSREMYSSMSSSKRGADEITSSASTNNSKNNSRANFADSPQFASNDSTVPSPKKAEVIRLGLANVKTGGVGEGINAAELSGAVQNTLAEYLKMPNVEIVGIESKLPSAIDAEAKQKECDFVIYATVSHKKGGGGGMFECSAR